MLVYQCLDLACDSEAAFATKNTDGVLWICVNSRPGVTSETPSRRYFDLRPGPDSVFHSNDDAEGITEETRALIKQIRDSDPSRSVIVVLRSGRVNRVFPVFVSVRTTAQCLLQQQPWLEIAKMVINRGKGMTGIYDLLDDVWGDWNRIPVVRDLKLIVCCLAHPATANHSANRILSRRRRSTDPYCWLKHQMSL